MFLIASPVAESRAALHVVSRPQGLRTAGTLESLIDNCGGGSRLVADKLHQLKCRAGRKLETLIFVEPERLTCRTKVDLDRRTQLSVHRHAGHWR